MGEAGFLAITEAEVARRKAYLEIRPEDERRLRDAHAHLLPHSGTIIDRFYDYLLSHEQIRSILAPPGLIERLKGMQARYFDELTAGTYDVPYFENRLKVGLAHNRVGLSPEWYLGAYNKYLNIASDVLSLAFGRDYERYFQTMASLSKLIDLDMGLAIDAYNLCAQAELKTVNEGLRRLEGTRRQLTDMIVHDLQNPLAGITAFLHHLEANRQLSAGEREALTEALRRCGDLSQMILNVLQVSRAEEGKLQTYIEDVDLAEMARECAAVFRLAAEQDGRSIEVDSPPSSTVRTDPSAHLPRAPEPHPERAPPHAAGDPGAGAGGPWPSERDRRRPGHRARVPDAPLPGPRREAAPRRRREGGQRAGTPLLPGGHRGGRRPDRGGERREARNGVHRPVPGGGTGGGSTVMTARR